MKKLLGLSVLALALTACSQNQPVTAAAQSVSNGAAFSNVISVQQALSSADDTYVTLEGTLLNKAGNEAYLFSDGTGKIRVEIDDDVWRGQHVGSSDNRVRLSGEIDRNHNGVELDVKQITVIQQ